MLVVLCCMTLCHIFPPCGSFRSGHGAVNAGVLALTKSWGSSKQNRQAGASQNRNLQHGSDLSPFPGPQTTWELRKSPAVKKMTGIIMCKGVFSLFKAYFNKYAFGGV